MPSPLLSPCRSPDSQGLIQRITPESAGWEYVGFEVFLLKKGMNLKQETHDTEVCLVLVEGKASVQTRTTRFDHIGERRSPFERIPPFSVYVPPKDMFEVTAETDVELAVCRAPAKGVYPARLIAPSDVSVEDRGRGRNCRHVHTILGDESVAERLLVVEVYTDEGNTSSYPSHKHDRDAEPDETLLEETYYHRIDPPQGFCLQRVYTDRDPKSGERTLDECTAAYNRDVVMAPRGYHPVATLAGYDSYYLNVMAGPVKRWRFTWEKDHAWINSDAYPRPQKRP